MNKEYVYVNGKVTIIDDKKEKRQEEYYDNLDKVLVKENVIERINKQIDELEMKVNQYKRSRSNKLFCLIPLLGGIIASLIGPLLVISMTTGQNLTSLVLDNSYSDYVLSFTLKVFPFGLSLGTIMSVMEYLQYRKHLKEEKGVSSQLDYLNQQLKIEKDKLEVLQKDKSKEKEDRQARIVKVNEIEELKKMRSELAQYYELGYNIDKYYHYYMQGKLEDKMPDNINIDFAKNYIKQKKLTKKD